MTGSNLQKIRSQLSTSGVLAAALPGETCVVVAPTRRVKAGRFAVMLVDNGVKCRAVGHGKGSVQDALGHEFKTNGILVLAVDSKHVRRTELYAKLVGVVAVPINGGPP